MDNANQDMGTIEYAEKVKKILVSDDGFTNKPDAILELYPDYTLILGRMRGTGIRRYTGIEPWRPERTKQAIAYEDSFEGNGLKAQVIQENPSKYLKKMKPPLENFAIISYKLDEKAANIADMAKILYNLTPDHGINIHLGLKDDAPFIKAGFKKKGDAFVKL